MSDARTLSRIETVREEGRSDAHDSVPPPSRRLGYCVVVMSDNCVAVRLESPVLFNP